MKVDRDYKVLSHDMVGYDGPGATGVVVVRQVESLTPEKLAEILQQTYEAAYEQAAADAVLKLDQWRSARPETKPWVRSDVRPDTNETYRR